MKNFKFLLSLSLIGIVFSSCSPTTTSLRGQTSASYARSKAKPNRVTEAAARPYSRPSARPQMRKASPMSKRNASRVRHVRTTAYSCAEKEKGGIYGRKNASGTTLKYGAVRSAAADWSRYPLGTKFKIVGQPHTYVVDDYGSALVGTDTIDIYKPNLSMMNAWGVRNIDIEILEWGSYSKSYNLVKGRRSHAHCWQMYKCLKPKVGA